MAAVARIAIAQDAAQLPGTKLLTPAGDLSAQMVEGIDRWLMRETERISANRAAKWASDLDTVRMAEKYPQTNPGAQTAEQFRQARRDRLREIIGAVDPIVPNPRLQFIGDNAASAEVYRTVGGGGFVAWRVRWPVFEGVFGEGLLLEPLDQNGKVRGFKPCVVAIPDAYQTPEMIAGLRAGVAPASQFARHLVASGWCVLVPVLTSRDDSFSGNDRLKRFTNQPHREWIYRQSYEMGRHIVGYEVQKIIAGINAMEIPGSVAVAGYGEGGLIALHVAALDGRVGSLLVSGYFGPRDRIWSEPIYRNLSGFVREFGDAELAALVAPRKVVIEYAKSPEVKGPPPAQSGRGGAAPGVIATADFGDVESEVDRANKLAPNQQSPFAELVYGSEGSAVTFGSRKALTALARGLKITNETVFDTNDPKLTAVPLGEITNRQARTVRELEAFTQALFRRSESARHDRVWKALGNTNDFFSASSSNREFFWRKVIGKIDATKVSANPRTRQIYDKPKWTGYEVMLDVLPDVFAWGYLLVPKDLKPGERRPVVVCQHGLEGVPEDTVADDPKHKGYGPYKAFAARLAERGFIVYAPHNPYRGQDKFRVLQRKANPLGLSLFSFIIAQHEVTTDWLASLPFVDPQRIAFYGLSYGGKTAMRVPAVVERYCLSICSADFNEWVQKCVTTESPYSYMFTGEYEMPEWNLGHTFNYAEMASLIAPRPFMVERGHDDGVAPDQWVAYEYAKIRRTYDKLGIGERTEIEFFNGPHTINGVGTFKFLHRHLNWPEPKQP